MGYFHAGRAWSNPRSSVQRRRLWEMWKVPEAHRLVHFVQKHRNAGFQRAHCENHVSLSGTGLRTPGRDPHTWHGAREI